MLVAVPSKGRAGETKTMKLLPHATLFVPEDEEAAYRAGARGAVVGVPASVRGITATRNWILDHADEERVVMIDDDVRCAGWIRMLPFRSKHHQLNEAEWLTQFERAFDVCEEMGLAIWGVSSLSAPRAWYPFQPFLFRTYVMGSLVGMFRSGPRFDESFPVKEDFELCLRLIERDGGVLGLRYLYWETEHWDVPGGCADYRTQDLEERMTRRLVEKYGRYIRRVERGGSRYSIELEF